jgi:hypothetical protein
MAGIIEAISSVGSAIAGGFNIVLQVIGLKNDPAMKKAQNAQKEKDKEDEINNIITNRDTEAAKKGQSR